MATTKLTGERIEELKAKATTHFWPHARQAGDMSEETGVNIVTSDKGVWVEDAQGKQWFDMLSGMWLHNIGHGRQEIADAVHAQLSQISFSANLTASPVTIDLAAKVASLAPDKEARVYFVSGGSEAVETAIKMAKNYQKKSWRAQPVEGHKQEGLVSRVDTNVHEPRRQRRTGTTQLRPTDARKHSRGTAQ